MDEERFEQAADVISNAEVLVITAGAGMGVDSGLPDFRGIKGFWNAYPPYERLGLSFIDMANPCYFETDPAFAWGFYGHRTKLYRETIPHEGFQIIRKWVLQRNIPYFIVTSNVDGQFQKAGFPENRILEIHGSIHWLQCASPCSNLIWPNNEQISVDETTMKSAHIPLCPNCGGISRPNILMFEDGAWLPNRTNGQRDLFGVFVKEDSAKRMAVIEIGAGKAVSNIRAASEILTRKNKSARIIRINLREAKIGRPNISIPYGALESLLKIDSLIY